MCLSCSQVLNESTFEPLPFLKWTNASSGSLNAKSESRAAVKPEQFRVGPFKVQLELVGLGDPWLFRTHISNVAFSAIHSKTYR
jgi:hypothetical protein